MGKKSLNPLLEKKQKEDWRTSLLHLVENLPSDISTKKLWQEIFHLYKTQGLSHLQKLLEFPKQQKALLQILEAINSEKNLEKLLQLILDTAIQLIRAERGFLLVKKMKMARNFDQEDISEEHKISQKIADSVLETGMGLRTNNAQMDQRVSLYSSVQEFQLLSILCYPLMVKGKTVGVIYLDNRLVEGHFSQEDFDLFALFAEQAAIAIENARLHNKLTRKAKKISNDNEFLRTQVDLQSKEMEILRCSLDWKNSSYKYSEMYSKSESMQQVFDLIEKIKDTQFPILIQGESGTGKELIAQAVHFMGKYAPQKFVSENCAAISESIFEAELFGYEKGAFTGANQIKKGLFEEAEGGTLFLDEVGELPLLVQKKLLRTLAEKTIRRVGGRETIPINVRIVTATNRNLQEMVNDGEFREDLFYRLNMVSIELPPLRERKEDIPLLIEHFLGEISQLTGEKVKRASPELMAVLLSYNWPGNIRQLQNEIYRLAILCEKELLSGQLSPEVKGQKKISRKVKNLPDLINQVEKDEIAKALSLSDNNKSKAAQLLGLTRFSLQRKMEKHGIEV